MDGSEEAQQVIVYEKVFSTVNKLMSEISFTAGERRAG